MSEEKPRRLTPEEALKVTSAQVDRFLRTDPSVLAAVERIAGPGSFLAKASGKKPEADPEARFRKRIRRKKK